MNPFPNNPMPSQNRFTPSMFMTPQGNVYVIDSPLEVANVPMGTGISIAICPNESIMYLKMYQNGTPSITAYKLAPYEQPTGNNNLDKVLQNITERLEKIEKFLTPQKEDKINDLL